MKNIQKTLCALLAFLVIVAAPGLAHAGKTPEERIMGGVRILGEMAQEDDSRYMTRILKEAYGVAIFPSVVKAGFIFGGRYGEGLLLKRDRKTGRWYGPNFVNIGGASWGLQVGVQSTALVLVITNRRGMDGFVGDKVTLGGDLAVSAGPVGRNTSAATDGKLKASIYSYSMSKGLFAGLSLEGAYVSVDKHTNHLYWDKPVSAYEALGEPAKSQKILPLTRELNHLIESAE